SVEPSSDHTEREPRKSRRRRPPANSSAAAGSAAVFGGVWRGPRAGRGRGWRRPGAAPGGPPAAAFWPGVHLLAAQYRGARHALVVNNPMSFRHLFDLLGTSFFDVSFLGLLLPDWFVPALGAAAVAACATGGLLGRGAADAVERRARDYAIWHAAGFVGLVFAAELVAGRPVTQARYFVPLTPYLFLLVARALSRPGSLSAAARVAAEILVVAGTFGYFAAGLIVDPRLGALAASLRRVDRRLPVVYLETYYYLPMRFYYMPERAHFLVVAGSVGADFAGLVTPTYDGLIDARRLRRLGPVVVMDEKRVLGGPARFLGTGAQVAASIAAAPALSGPPARP
ncbi:MAG: hypothetical protein ACHQ49_09565, partial [Elusimicrobiota bacterium]